MIDDQIWADFARPVPEWFHDAAFGVFIHWGPYSVPAWAEPIGPLGTIAWQEWYRHNPYAEWYANTIRLDSPAAEHHRATWGNRPYDAFLDDWRAEAFDAHEVAKTIRVAGARYLIPTTKHHDGIPLWDAPGSTGHNAATRGPTRDLVSEFADGARANGLRFGTYYSGGLDWHFNPHLPPISADVQHDRPNSAGYARYAAAHVRDLIDRHQPDIIWGDINWPDAGKTAGPDGLVELFRHYYDVVPDGVINDRFGVPHHDYGTSEYEHGREAEHIGKWEHCRGTGYSFGHNRLEDDASVLTGAAAARELVDIVSRGGNFLLNIGLTASGEIPLSQRRTLAEVGAWNTANGEAIFGSRPLASATPTDDAWSRWTATEDTATVFVDQGVPTRIPIPADVDPTNPRALPGARVLVEREGTTSMLTVTGGPDGPAALRFDRR